ncbi:MAG: potassium transporter Kup, partial [Alphaproteobacteria bacterium]|nr:potassium transporter Kup [Alphaproteobacteria bacterium]
LSVAVLLPLFVFQSGGTKRIGNAFGPIMVLWFLTIGALGLRAILAAPEIWHAVNPIYAVDLIVAHSGLAASIFGAVLLVFTGVEALYADMGHFGLSPIRRAWFALVMPCLLLNYLGQGALLLARPEAASNPFYLLAPPDLLVPMILLASAATVIASQAVISGAFSIVQQAVQLDILPRLSIKHTSASEVGQIYVPRMNWLLCAGVLLLVVMFRTSGSLAHAYGFAVAGTMLATTILVFTVLRYGRHWSWGRVMLVMLPFLVVDLTFFTLALAKIPEGGWLPLCLGAVVCLIFMTWRDGREVVRAHRRGRGQKLEAFLATLADDHPPRVRGTAVYLTRVCGMMPMALTSNLRHNKVLHERVIIVTVLAEEEPRVPEEDRATIQNLGKNFWKVGLHYGFMERPDVVRDLQTYLLVDCPLDISETSFFLGHDIFVEGAHPLKPRWREKLFLWLSNHEEEAARYFRIPPSKVVEMGVQVEV